MVISSPLKWRPCLQPSKIALVVAGISRQPHHSSLRMRPNLVNIPSFSKMKNPSRQSSFQPEVKKYNYTPLDASKDSIRLLRLIPTKDSTSPIQCEIFRTTLATAPPYVALSYAWGDKSGTQAIFIGDEIVSVTPNLKHALQRLRNGTEELVLWVDAICINQDDIPERNVQTANMRAIYQGSESVAVWLGLENSHGLESNGSKEAMILARDLNLCSKDEVRAIVTDPERAEELEALVVLFRRQYWWRIWVIQEVSSAKKAMIYCGDESIPWEQLDNVCDILKEQEEHLQALFYKSPSYVRTLTDGGPRGLQLSRYSPNVAAPPLLELLISHKSKKSTDPKDKVYALVGISNSRHSFGKINYSLHLREIYTHTARHIISTTQKLDVVCVKQHDIPLAGLPTWAPDWMRAPSNSGATVVGLHHHQPEFRAAGNSLADVEFLSGGYSLKASGFILGTAKTLGMPYKKRGNPGNAVPALHAFHDWWNLFVFSHSDSTAAQAIFGSTISCGNWMFEDDDVYASKMEAIFDLSDSLLSDSDRLRLDTPSRTGSTFSAPSRTGTMSSSIQSLVEGEDDYGGDEEEKTQLSTILSASLTMNRRRFFLTGSGLVGLAPWNTEMDDIVCVLLGCRFPVVMRRKEDYYFLIGEAYVDGFMDGEAMVALKEGEYMLETFEIH